MKYSFNTWAYCSFPNWLPAYPLKDTIERLAGIGYDALEIGAAAPHAWPYYLNEAKRKEIVSWLNANNIKVSSMLTAAGGGPGANAASAMPEEREWTVQYYKDVCDLAADLNCKRVLYVGGWYIYGTRQRDAWDNTRKSLVEIATYAKERNVRICIEPTSSDSNLINSADDALDLMNESGCDNVGVMFDTAHAFYRNEPSADYIYKMSDHLEHIHLADYDRRAPGTGGADFVPIMQALKDIEYQGYVTMEAGFTDRLTPADTCARLSLENLKAIEAILK